MSVMPPIQAKYFLSDFPSRLVLEDLNEILLDFENLGSFSDMYVASEQPLTVRAGGELFPVSARRLASDEVGYLLNDMVGENSTTELGIANPIDFSHEVRVHTRGEKKRLRYRGNATAVRPKSGTLGISVTLRAISSMPWDLDAMDVEPQVQEGFIQDQGLVLVTGSTGSGKSTLLSGFIRRMLESKQDPKVVLTYEQPIEYVYDEIEIGNSVIYQSEVPTHVRTFAEGVVTSLRRNPDVILVGEARDRETITAASEAAMTGHLVISTVHANSVAETLRRMVIQFDSTEQNARLVDLTSAIKMIVTQRLEKTLDGGRVPLREFLIFTPEIRGRIFDAGVEGIVPTLIELVREHGRSMHQSAQIAYDKGLISEETLRRAEKY